MINTKRLVFLGLLVSQALVLSIIESWIPMPALMMPGVKLGLANIITLIVITFFGYKEAFLVVIARCILASFFGGGMIVFLFSMAGGLLSTAVMAFLYMKLSKVFSVLGVSVAGSISHNIGQLAMASFMMKELAVMTYLPILLISGIIMGCFVGLCSGFLTKALRKSGILL
jgi:heptaprenyl diphosphate synthase